MYAYVVSFLILNSYFPEIELVSNTVRGSLSKSYLLNSCFIQYANRTKSSIEPLLVWLARSLKFFLELWAYISG